MATGGLYLNVEWRGKRKKVLRVVLGVFIYLLFIYLFIYYFFISEIHGHFSKRSEVDLYVILEKL